MLLHLLDGRFDVDPATIDLEGFARDGRVYAYFGIFPALLRLPMMVFADLRTAHLERISCWLAMLIGGAAQAWAVFTVLRGTGRGGRLLLPPLLLIAVLSGPGVMLGTSQQIYNEAMLWAWALASVFVAVALRGLFAWRLFPGADLCAMAAAAGATLLARPTTGIGLYAALAAIGVCLLCREGWRAAFTPRLLAPFVLAGALAAAAGLVNHGRWGNPLTVADPRLQLMNAVFPDRLARLDKYGLFHIDRAPLLLMYYLLPLWTVNWHGSYLWQDRINELYDGLELPPSTPFLTDPLTIALAVAGLWIWRFRPPGPRGAAALCLLAGLAVPPALMLTAWYGAFRYRAEYAPLLFAAGCLGARLCARPLTDAADSTRRHARRWIWTACGVQLAAAFLFGILQSWSPLGPFYDVLAKQNASGLGALYLQILKVHYWDFMRH